jgi:hypothetical protein
MPHPTGYANALQHYNSALTNLETKIQQDRQLHMHEMTNVYMEAVRSGVPHSYLTMVESMISDRDAFSARKTVLDAAEMTAHDNKLETALQQNSGVLRGGARGLEADGRSAKKGLEYAAKRSNALLYNLHKKLHHDRSLHHQELGNLYTEAARLGGRRTAFASMLENMVRDRQMFNARKTALDAAQWAQVENLVESNAGHKVLQAGADVPSALQGGATHRYKVRSKAGKRSSHGRRSRSHGRRSRSQSRRRHKSKSKSQSRHLSAGAPADYNVPPLPANYDTKSGYVTQCNERTHRFNNEKAANMWRMLMNSRDVQCSPVNYHA